MIHSQVLGRNELEHSYRVTAFDYVMEHMRSFLCRACVLRRMLIGFNPRAAEREVTCFPQYQRGVDVDSDGVYDNGLP